MQESVTAYLVLAGSYCSLNAKPDLPLGVKLKDVFTYRFPRASHHPAAFCVLMRHITCSYHRFFHEIKAIIGNLYLFVKRASNFFP